MIQSVLIVDDEPSDRFVAARIVRKVLPDIPIFELTNGQEALDFILSETGYRAQCRPHPPPTLLLVDINMPVLGGFEFLEQLEMLTDKAEVERYWFAVTMFTSSSNPRDREKAAAIQCVRDYLVKPFTAASFQELLAKHFRAEG